MLRIEDSYNEKPLQISEQQGVKKAPMTKRVLVRNSKVECDYINIWKNRTEDPERKVFERLLFWVSHGAQSTSSNCM